MVDAGVGCVGEVRVEVNINILIDDVAERRSKIRFFVCGRSGAEDLREVHGAVHSQHRGVPEESCQQRRTGRTAQTLNPKSLRPPL